MDNLNISSEMILVSACLNIAARLPSDDEFEFMRAVIPHLRLLLLDAEQLDDLSEYLQDDEKIALSERLNNDEDWSIEALNLNPCRYARKHHAISFFSETNLPKNMNLVARSDGSDVYTCKNMELYGLKCKALQNLCLISMDILTRYRPFPADDETQDEPLNYEETIAIAIKCLNEKGNWEYVYRNLTQPRPILQYNSWFTHKIGPGVLIPKGTEFEVHVLVPPQIKPVQYQKLSSVWTSMEKNILNYEPFLNLSCRRRTITDDRPFIRNQLSDLRADQFEYTPCTRFGTPLFNYTYYISSALNDVSMLLGTRETNWIINNIFFAVI